MRYRSNGFETLLYYGALLAAAWLAASDVAWAAPGRVAAGLALTTLLPGFALSKLLFPGHGELTLAERLALSVASSVALVALVAFLLDLGPWAIARRPLIVGLVGASSFLALAAFVRSHLLVSAARRAGRAERVRGDVGGRTFTLLSLSLVLTVAGFWSAMQFLSPTAGATEFYLLDDAGRLEGYPTSWEAGDTLEVVVGITSHERTTERFWIDAAGETVARSPMLRPGETWTEELRFTAPEDAAAEPRIPLELYMAGGGGEPYRRLYLQAVPGASP